MPRATGPAVGAFAGSGNRAARRSATASYLNLSLEHEALSCRRLTDMPAAWSCDCSKATGFRYALTPRQALRTALCEYLRILHVLTRVRYHLALQRRRRRTLLDWRTAVCMVQLHGTTSSTTSSPISCLYSSSLLQLFIPCGLVCVAPCPM